ncbi:hypothetical protein [Roseomonas sp. USHLN139]|uniref:hypothetical protein n=1 Tax=Roseomonas sp. USHLN139 TaxID=3081298 RepID=UPI003B017804
MQRPDLPARVAHALRPEIRAQQVAQLAQLRTWLIDHQAGHLLTRVNELAHAEGMLRELAAESGLIAAPPPTPSPTSDDALAERVARGIHIRKGTPNTVAGGEADREAAEDMLETLAAVGLSVVERPAHG